MRWMGSERRWYIRVSRRIQLLVVLCRVRQLCPETSPSLGGEGKNVLLAQNAEKEAKRVFCKRWQIAKVCCCEMEKRRLRWQRGK